MITKEDIKTGVKLKLLCSRGRVLKGKGMRSAGTVITIKSVDTANNEFEDTDGHAYWICDLQDFDLVSSALPTDRPLTYDETQMLQAGDVIKNYSGEYVISSVDRDVIKYAKNAFNFIGWMLSPDEKSTNGEVYFISRPEVKEEKKEILTSENNNKLVFAGGIGIPDWRAESPKTVTKETPMNLQYISHDFCRRSSKDTATKSVSQILYGR